MHVTLRWFGPGLQPGKSVPPPPPPLLDLHTCSARALPVHALQCQSFMLSSSTARSPHAGRSESGGGVWHLPCPPRSAPILSCLSIPHSEPEEAAPKLLPHTARPLLERVQALSCQWGLLSKRGSSGEDVAEKEQRRRSFGDLGPRFDANSA